MDICWHCHAYRGSLYLKLKEIEAYLKSGNTSSGNKKISS
ncbi:hypothetical protein MC7420_1540 [Coleofasciculus chthonoplastes PCC 7420]|uniref:Uncharacterized protein n=1 Tax=Coleofasciculus chthonoplastes PCC 7420 TaxID=118168 RepID=B4W4T7_9CYAN|nr:hypothetical protein MC7420_1540 [Coleofasciculus chthonoplastes PCC 7420]